MKLSLFCIPTLKEVPSDVKLKSHNLMIRSGMIRMEASGIYTWLPLGFKVLEKIQKIIIDEHINESINQILMPTIQSADIWKQSERYDSYGKEMLKIEDRNNKELLYGPTNEEMITKIGSDVIKSYKNLPLSFFHIQSKFRDEIRPRFGVMRAREFLMKDAYSFDSSQEHLDVTYEKFYNLYIKIFNKLGLNAIPARALTGEIGGNLSHEFHLVCQTGESEIFLDKRLNLKNVNNFQYDQFEKNFFCATKEYAESNSKQIKDLNLTNSIEIGHIFSFGEKYSKKFNFKVNTPHGSVYPLMGSYGIGVSRIPAAIIECHNDEKGIIWPKKIAPFQIIILNLKSNNNECFNLGEKLYHELREKKIDVLFDDRDERAGVKFSNAELIGIPIQIIIGSAYIEKKEVSLKFRNQTEEINVSYDKILEKILEILLNDK